MLASSNASSTSDDYHRNVDSGWNVQHVADDYLSTTTSLPRQSILSSLSHYVKTNFSASPSHNRRRPSISLTAHGHEVTISPPSYSTVRFVFLCSLWYMSSAMSSNTGKVILNHFRFPITLTIVQFAFVSGLSALMCHPMFNLSTLRPPTKSILWKTVPMAAFQVGGHMFSSVAISRIPVSTVHTIKALSPLFTVAAYALLFRVEYSPATYISLLPLTVGVMLACSFDMSTADFIGLASAFGSAIVFVSSNIFFKKVMPSNSGGSGALTKSSQKLDKINLLLYSSGIAFSLMIPMWVSSDFGPLMDLWSSSGIPDNVVTNSRQIVIFNFLLNGVVHWGQNLIAFAILGLTSPVTYSIASLIKRIAVICIAILWFNQHIHPIQGFGIFLTFVGLWMYNNATGDVERGECKVRRMEARAQTLLPVSQQDVKLQQGSPPPGEKGDNEKSDTNQFEGRSTAVPRVEFANGYIPAISSTRTDIPLPSHSNVAHTRRVLSPITIPSHQIDHATKRMDTGGHTHQPQPIQSPKRSYPSPPLSNSESPPHSSPRHGPTDELFDAHPLDAPHGSHLHFQSLKARRGVGSSEITVGELKDLMNIPNVSITASS